MHFIFPIKENNFYLYRLLLRCCTDDLGPLGPRRVRVARDGVLLARRVEKQGLRHRGPPQAVRQLRVKI